MLRSFGGVGYPGEVEYARRGLAVSRKLCRYGFEDLQRVSLGPFAILFTGLERQCLGELDGNATEEAVYAIDATDVA
jgi:hypothetical protein